MGCNCGKHRINTQPRRVVKAKPHESDSENKVRRIIRRVAK